MLYCKEADAREKSEAFLQVHSVWPHAKDPAEHLALRLASVQHQRAHWYVGLYEGQIVSSLGLYPYRLFGPDGHRPLRVIGALFTAENARGKGHAQELLRWVIKQESEKGVQDFALFSDIGTHYYQQFGFQALPSYEWEIDVALANIEGEGRRPELLPLATTQPGTMGCAFGIDRSREDDLWMQAKQKGPLRLASWGREGWLLSRSEGERYILLESNLSQEAPDWPLFRQAVACDAAAVGARYAQGWWTAAAAEPLPEQSEVIPREREIFMWLSLRGRIDSWFDAMPRQGFRVFLSEHV